MMTSSSTHQHIIEQLLGLHPASKTDLILQVEQSLGDMIVHKIDTHNTRSVLFILKSGSESSGLLALKAEHGRLTATGKEIDWYSQLKTNSSIPTVVFSNVSDTHSLLLMEYIKDARTLDDMARTDYDPALAEYYRQAIMFDRSLHEEYPQRRVSFEEMNKFYADKFERRYQESVKYEYLKQLMSADSHVLNGREFHSLRYYIERISNDRLLREYLTPDTLGLVHGDLHGGNILVSNGRVNFVDPNGSPEMPIEYDYGKIFHSVHGGYPLIMAGSYTLSRHDHGYIFELEPFHTGLYANIKKLFVDSELARGLYAEAMHFATMLPHHAGNKQETTALFYRAIELFDELYYAMDIK